MRTDSVGLVRFLRLLICLALFFLPTIYIDLLVPNKSKAGVALAREIYYATVIIFLAVTLLKGWHSSSFVVFLTIYFIADILVHLTGQVFVWGGQSIDPSRSLLLAVINYFEIAMAFAIFYRHWDCLSPRPLSGTQALYFSIVTGATVGYGDVLADTPVGKRLVILQIATSFLFVAIFLSTLLGRTASPRESEK
ncbi:MAG: hypothetical protein V7609_856 [Verrucomicrobiota bacterium]